MVLMVKEPVKHFGETQTETGGGQLFFLKKLCVFDSIFLFLFYIKNVLIDFGEKTSRSVWENIYLQRILIFFRAKIKGRASCFFDDWLKPFSMDQPLI